MPKNKMRSKDEILQQAKRGVYPDLETGEFAVELGILGAL